jgi:YD repeat-containing protein
MPISSSSYLRLGFGYLLLLALSGIASASQFTYDDIHRLKTADYGNGFVIQYDYDAAGNRNSRIVQSPYSAQAQIVVQDNGATPATTLTDGTSTVAFGSITAGQNTVRTFSLSNLGISSLSGLAISVDGVNAADFTVTQPAVTTLSTSASASFTVTFSPTTSGSKAASLHIASNDPNHNPFIVLMSGTSPPLIESWRQTYFDAGANSGDAADTADPDRDGLNNLMEYAYGLNPTQSQFGPLAFNGNTITRRGKPTTIITNTASGASFQAVFMRRKDYKAAGLTYVVAFSSDFVNWTDSTATPTVIAQDNETQVVAVPYPPLTGNNAAYFCSVRVTLSQ